MAQVNGNSKAASKGKATIGNKKAAGAANGASAPAPELTQESLIDYAGAGKPDRDAYNQEQEKIKSQIAVKQAQLNKVKEKIQDTTGRGPAGEKRQALRNEQAELRSKTAGFKDERTAAMNQIKTLQDGISKKIKDMQNAKFKSNYKSVGEIDNRIKDLERQVESGTMRLVEEKRALSEISDLRRSRKTFDTFGSSQDSIDADKAKVDELKAKLDNPEFKALQERYSAIQAQLDEINKEMTEVNSSRDKLYDERNALNEEVNKLWSLKKESAGNFKEANDKYYTKANEERARRVERQQAERRQYEESKRKEINEQLLEEARMPAFAREIEDCTTLINYFSKFVAGGANVPEPTLSTVSASDSKAGIAAVPQLELRKVENDIPEGAIMMKKKPDDDNYFSGKSKKKGGNKKAAASAASENNTSASLNLPFQIIAALLQFNISAPLSRDDVPKTVDGLKEKRSYYEENQDRVTKERTTEAEDRIAKADAKAKAANPSTAEDDATADADEAADAKTAEAADGVAKLSVEDK